ncbi:hypothetical protein COV11_00510 [Candidatus Woesearchaeota archaeon CG10_big_fil_rev_8_21_14_0_10_30_7]|nr:MAG: hypothetical protein COV11_00510 [Candidatus Woesearchaeota archaeon CG10_big_fil_rev_8_21_14_0_10_30_7]
MSERKNKHYLNLYIKLINLIKIISFMGELILVPEYKKIEGPVIFLAGPIQGSEDWQKEGVEYVLKNSKFNVASPRRDYLPGKFVYDEQVDWETHYLNEAAKNGCIIFWLAKESKHQCDRAYAQTTRFEIAEWTTHHQYDNSINIVVGIEQGFTGAKYIRKRLINDCPDIPLFNNLEDACECAIFLTQSSQDLGVQ